MRQVRTHTCAPGTSPKLKSLQDLSTRVKPEVTEEGRHHDGLWADGGLHLRLHMCKIIHPSHESSDPLHPALSLVSPITSVPLQRSIPVEVPGRGRGSGLEASLGVTMRGVVTTPSWWACGVVVACCAASMRARPRVHGGHLKLWCASPIRSNCSVQLSQEYRPRAALGNRIAMCNTHFLQE
jgi:hypothetical protein